MKWLPQSGRLLLKHFYCECSNSWFILSNRVFELNAKIYWSCSGSMWWPNNLMRQLTLCSLWISQEPASEHFPSTFGIFIDSPVFFFVQFCSHLLSLHVYSSLSSFVCSLLAQQSSLCLSQHLYLWYLSYHGWSLLCGHTWHLLTKLLFTSAE